MASSKIPLPSRLVRTLTDREIAGLRNFVQERGFKVNYTHKCESTGIIDKVEIVLVGSSIIKRMVNPKISYHQEEGFDTTPRLIVSIDSVNVLGKGFGEAVDIINDTRDICFRMVQLAESKPKSGKSRQSKPKTSKSLMSDSWLKFDK